MFSPGGNWAAFEGSTCWIGPSRPEFLLFLLRAAWYKYDNRVALSFNVWTHKVHESW